MKKLVLLTVICLWHTFIFAQGSTNSDSLAYQLQRAKINAMLAQRTVKFGQYSESLSKHTGIFGLQTKKDIRRSNDILMDIAKTDDSIFMQIKILLNYRAYQQQQAQTKSVQAENYSLAYMGTINKLREQIDELKRAAIIEKQQQGKRLRTYIIIFVLMLGSILYLITKKRRVNT